LFAQQGLGAGVGEEHRLPGRRARGQQQAEAHGLELGFTSLGNDRHALCQGHVVTRDGAVQVHIDAETGSLDQRGDGLEIGQGVAAAHGQK
jgi:hypothetical protein